MGLWKSRRGPSIAVFQADGANALAATYVHDQLATLNHHSAAPLEDVFAVVQELTVPGYGELLHLEVSANTPAGRLQVRAAADSAFAAVDKTRDRLLLRLAEWELQKARTEQGREAMHRLAHKRSQWWRRWWPHRAHGAVSPRGDSTAAPDNERTNR
ncbi:hypothetical protein [Salinactinospora qingdaonensis]|uniref:Ribosome-associated translation inhibitor RaiA n=1 Tax=Salinactinospora qingdaonensis TaxID=702744 RepID=A0ABP7FTP7_9ACTN